MPRAATPRLIDQDAVLLQMGVDVKGMAQRRRTHERNKLRRRAAALGCKISTPLGPRDVRYYAHEVDTLIEHYTQAA